MKEIDSNKRKPAASMKVEASDSILNIGNKTIGDKNCPKNQNVVSLPISFPLIAGGVIFITHILVFGIIIPIPKPDRDIAATTIMKELATAIQENPAAISKYPIANTDK